MFSRFSVKKPYTIIVLVIVALILGGVSLSRTKTDLLPEMDLPYLAVITTNPGANAEKIETEITSVLEGALSTVSGVESVTSNSADNFSMVFLQFQDGTNMDSAMVKVSSAVNTVSSKLPDNAGTPNYLEINADMMASMYVVATYDGKDIYDLSSFVEKNVVPELSRQDGVADVSVSGNVARTVEVRLSDSKIEDINNKILGEVNDQLYDAKKKIDEGEAALDDAKDKIDSQKKSLEEKQDETAEKMAQGESGLTTAVAASMSQISTYGAQLQSEKTALAGMGVDDEKMQQLGEAVKAATGEDGQIDQMALVQACMQLGIDPTNLPSIMTSMQNMQELATKLETEQENLKKLQGQLAQIESGQTNAAAQFGSANAQLAAAETTIESNKKELESARSQYKESRKTALKSANIDKLVEKSTLAQIIGAQDFSMPAGYIDAGKDDQWMLRVGTEIKSLSELKNLLLTKVDGVGNIRLSDVADVTVVDNVGDAYMKLNKQDGVLLSIFKGSTANTSEVSQLCRETIEKLTTKYAGLNLEIVSDQGRIIGWYIQTILQALLLGALLAVVILAIFLRDWKPTLIVAFSIPFSVLCSLVFMYFTGIQLNIMSLGGISMAVGMLVDNSIVVLENIYRLRARGVPAPRAAVQGAKQITGAVVASTLTTVCVFAPVLFTDGIVNQLMVPFALTIAYVLAASLIVALTLVPTLSSIVFKNYRPRENKWFAGVQDVYAKLLSFALRFKIVPLALSLALLGGAVYGVVNMGIVMIPDMTTKTVEVSVTMPEGTEKEKSYEIADEIMSRAMEIEGVRTVNGMDGTATVSAVSSGLGSSASKSDNVSRMISFNINCEESINTESGLMAVRDELVEKCSDLDCEIMTTADSSSMSSMLGSGLSIRLKGEDKDKLLEISEDLMKEVEKVEGYEEIENGMEDAATELRLIVDKDKLMRKGMTVAQLYADLAGRVNTSAKATDMVIKGNTVDVNIIDETKMLNNEDLLDTKIKYTNQKGEEKTFKLGDVAKVKKGAAAQTITHSNGDRVMTVTAKVKEGYNNALLARELQKNLESFEMPEGYTFRMSGELENINKMLEQMGLLLALGFALIYLIMVAQFQSLLSPFIIIFTVPLAFTGGFFGLLLGNEQLSMLSLMGFAVLMGTVVNNGIVFVDYVNQLRLGGLSKRDALIAAGRTRMRPILMTALTTILAMVPLIFSDAVGASMQRGMAMVVAGGLAYATLMTLFVVPVMYDLLYRRQPRVVDVGDDMDDDIDDAAEYLESLRAKGIEVDTVADPAASGKHAGLPASAQSKAPSDANDFGEGAQVGGFIPATIKGNHAR